MERTDKAITLAVDNATRIESTARLLRSHIDGAVTVMSGTTANGKTQFGSVGAGAGIIAVFSGGTATLTLDGVAIASGASPILAKLDAGGTLALSEEKSGATVMLIR